MASRIGHHIEFPDFSLDELMQIAELMLAREQYLLAPAARDAFREYIGLRMSQPRFANARSMRNAIDRLRLRQARRIVAGAGPIGRDDLIRLTATDVRGSRVFSDTLATPPVATPPSAVRSTGPAAPPSAAPGPAAPPSAALPPAALRPAVPSLATELTG
jgi:hypothetical protein